MRAVIMLMQSTWKHFDHFGPKEDVVIKMIGSESTGSWIRRARAAGTPDAVVGAESNTATQTLAVRSCDGWDPWEVWLLHIDQPRRHLAGRGNRTTG